MDTKLEELYMTMLTENVKSDKVEGSKIKPGESYEGSEKVDKGEKSMSKESGPEGKDNKIDKPVASPSVGDKSFEEGKGKPLSKKEGKVKEATEAKEDKILLSFDDLYNKTVNEEEEVVPAPDVEGTDFSEEEGDFTGGEETDIDEEIDLASELRLLADRLTEIADKLSVDEAGEATDTEEGPVEELPAPEGEAVIGKESVQVTEAIKSEPTPKPLKKTTLNPRMSQNPKNKIGKSGAGKAAMPKSKDHTGEPSPCPKTTLGPKMSQTVTGTGPAVKASNAPIVA